MVIRDTSTTLTPRGDRRIGERVSAGRTFGELLRPAGRIRIHTIKRRRARMSTHLFPAHRTEHDNPESFLIVAGVILAALVILIAFAAVTGASGAGACN
jgi:hypothetical protein